MLGLKFPLSPFVLVVLLIILASSSKLTHFMVSADKFKVNSTLLLSDLVLESAVSNLLG